MHVHSSYMTIHACKAHYIFRIEISITMQRDNLEVIMVFARCSEGLQVKQKTKQPLSPYNFEDWAVALWTVNLLHKPPDSGRKRQVRQNTVVVSTCFIKHSKCSNPLDCEMFHGKVRYWPVVSQLLHFVLLLVVELPPALETEVVQAVGKRYQWVLWWQLSSCHQLSSGYRAHPKAVMRNNNLWVWCTIHRTNGPFSSNQN